MKYKKTIDRKPYVFEYDMEKRIKALTKYDGFISFMFRDLDIVLLGEENAYVLEDLISKLRKIRNNIKSSGATPDQIEIYDKKVYDCFMRSVSVIRDRAINIDNPYMIHDIDLLNDISRYICEMISDCNNI